MRRGRSFTPFASRGRRPIVAILATFALVSALSVSLSIRTTSRFQHKATVVEVASRQRTLAERYVNRVLLQLEGKRADPRYTGSLLTQSARVLLDGGEVPAVNGDDDDTKISPASGTTVRAQLEQAQRLVADLTATGNALLAHERASRVPQTAHEHMTAPDGIQRLRILAAVTSNVSLNAARTIAVSADQGVTHLIRTQVILGAAGLITSLLLGWALIAAARRQTAHFRSLVSSSTDLVLVFAEGACRYVSGSVSNMLGLPEEDLLGQGFLRFIYPSDQTLLLTASAHAEPHEVLFRMKNRFGEWRWLEAHVTDLRDDRLVRGVVLNARDVTERVRLEEELTHQAFHDRLTDLANRALFRDRLDQALARSERSREVLSVLLIDLDGFKQVNDSLGHDAGDDLLQKVAKRLSTAIRPSDTLARLGGDEFAMLLEGTNEQGAVLTAQRLLERVSEPLSVAGREFTLGASVGIVLHPGGPGSSEELIRHADVAMYAAKESGRGRYEVFRYDMAREFGEVLGLEHELRLGLERGEFSLHYQVEVALEGTEIVGAEALMRWRSPKRGNVPPDRFIPIAETTGLILPLGEFALIEACRQAEEWRQAGLLPEGFVIWVNVSGKQLSAGGFDHLVSRTLETTGLPADCLGLEVTETAVVVEGPPGDRVRSELRTLHEAGIRIAIDDFGTGVSSLRQLRQFPVDMIKVDRSFVQGVEHDAKDVAIAGNLVSLAHALGLTAVAEGIESHGQLASMRGLNCDLAQGFLFAEPVPGRQMQELLAAKGITAKPPADTQAA